MKKFLSEKQPWFTLFLRLILGGVLLVAGGIKVTDPYASATSVRAYQVLPVPIANFLGFVLPFIEVGLGIFLIIGIWVRYISLLSAALMLVFVVAIGQAWARGISLDCGCFGKGGLRDTAELPVLTYTTEILRDIGLAILGGYLYRFPQGKLGFDKSNKLDKSDSGPEGENDGK